MILPARLARLLSPLAVLAVTAAGATQTLSWQHPDGTTHWYEARAVVGGVTWDAANAGAARAGGRLATITSAGENDFVAALIAGPEFWTVDSSTKRYLGPWTGGVQRPGSKEPDGGWIWASTEAMTFTSWAKGEPDDSGGADRLHFIGATDGPGKEWADAPGAKRLPGYVIEYDGPFVPVTLGTRLDAPGRSDGYTLFNPLASTVTYLVDTRGRVVNSWTSQHVPGAVAYLLDSGNLLRAGKTSNPTFGNTGGVGGIVEEFDWSGKRLWQARVSDADQCQHHDVERLPNGNTLMIVWERIPAGRAIAAGRDPALLTENELWPDKIVEVDPSGKVVWEWRTWDHIIQDFDSTKANYGDVGKEPGRIDVNFGSAGGVADWMHSNSVAYHAKLDQVLLSVRHFDEVWIIDHSTTTAEAATDRGGRSGKGGRLLYRWGNPRAYRAGTKSDQVLFQQHDAHWIADGLPGAGDIMIFNNGRGRPGGDASTVDQITPPTPDSKGNYPRTGAAWGPPAKTWTYPTPPRRGFYAAFTSGVQRLRNGNTLICEGANGRVVEITPDGTELWDYESPVVGGAPARQGSRQPDSTAAGNAVFRAPRYAPDHPALRGRKLTPGEPVEIVDTGLLAAGSLLPLRLPIGERAEFSIRAAGQAGGQYLAVTSVTYGLIPIDYRHLHLGFDPFVVLSMTATAPKVFQGYAGKLDAQGRAQAWLAVPDFAPLIDLDVFTSFLVVDDQHPTGFPFIGNRVRLRLTR